MLDIKSMTLEELKAEVAAMGEKPFRAGQLYQWGRKGISGRSAVSVDACKAGPEL